METHFTRGRLCRRALIVQGYHLNHAVVNDRRRAARSGADDAIPSSAGKPETLNPSKNRVSEKRAPLDFVMETSSRFLIHSHPTLL